MLRDRPHCVGFPRGRHPRPVLATVVDHRVPLIQGGTHALENLDPMCASCNARKSKQSDIRGRWRYR